MSRPPFFKAIPEWGVILTKSRLWLNREAAEAVHKAWAIALETAPPKPPPSYYEGVEDLRCLRAALVEMGWV